MHECPGCGTATSGSRDLGDLKWAFCQGCMDADGRVVKKYPIPNDICRGCGRVTHPLVSNWWDEKPEGIGIPTKCYAILASGTWIRGCSYNTADPLGKRFADELISKSQKGNPHA